MSSMNVYEFIQDQPSVMLLRGAAARARPGLLWYD